MRLEDLPMASQSYGATWNFYSRQYPDGIDLNLLTRTTHSHPVNENHHGCLEKWLCHAGGRQYRSLTTSSTFVHLGRPMEPIYSQNSNGAVLTIGEG